MGNKLRAVYFVLGPKFERASRWRRHCRAQNRAARLSITRHRQNGDHEREAHQFRIGTGANESKAGAVISSPLNPDVFGPRRSRLLAKRVRGRFQRGGPSSDCCSAAMGARKLVCRPDANIMAGESHSQSGRPTLTPAPITEASTATATAEAAAAAASSASAHLIVHSAMSRPSLHHNLHLFPTRANRKLSSAHCAGARGWICGHLAGANAAITLSHRYNDRFKPTRRLNARAGQPSRYCVCERERELNHCQLLAPNAAWPPAK